MFAAFPTVLISVTIFALDIAWRCLAARRRLHDWSVVGVASSQHSTIGVDFGHPVRVIDSAGTSWCYDCLTPCFKLAFYLNRSREDTVACSDLSAVSRYESDGWGNFYEMIRCFS